MPVIEHKAERVMSAPCATPASACPGRRTQRRLTPRLETPTGRRTHSGLVKAKPARQRRKWLW